MKKIKKYVVLQQTLKDCGIACMASIIKYYKGFITTEKLRDMTVINLNGISAYHVKKTLTKIGFKCQVMKFDLKQIESQKIDVPCIAHTIIDNLYSHYVVIYNINYRQQEVTVMDPSKGFHKYSFQEFNKIWSSILILCSPTKEFGKIPQPQSIYQFCKKLIFPHRQTIAFIFILSFFFTIFNIISSLYFKYIIDNLSMMNFYLLSLFFLTITIVKLLIDYLRNELLIYINKQIDSKLFLNLTNHIISLPYSYYKKRTTGELLSRINDLSYIREMISRLAVTLFIDMFLIVFSVLFLFSLNSKLFIITISILILYAINFMVFSKPLKKLNSNNIDNQALITSYLIESILAYNTIKGLSLEKEIKEQIKEKYCQFINGYTKLNQQYNIQNAIKNSISSVGTFAILFFGSVMVLQNQITIGTLITYQILFLYFVEPIRNIFDLEIVIRQAQEAIKRVIELYDIAPEENASLAPNNDLAGNIKFDHLNFTYSDEHYAIENLNLEIKKNEKVLIIGDSGVGKSTIAKLIMRYYQPNRHQLIINNQDINDYQLGSIRNNTSYASQNEVLFSDTILNNIKLYRDIDFEQIEAVSKMSLLNQMLEQRKINYNCFLTENGSNLSGGEKQKIIIARTLLKDSQIIILDECTSQIDLKSERIIFSNLISNYPDKTIIVISHRIENGDLFDRIITLTKKESE